jgi:lipid-A-disaccharide synthase
MRIGLIAGEASGDVLAAGLMREILAQRPEVQFFGVTGPRMREAGCESLADIEELSLIGLFEVLRHLPRLHALRGHLVQECLERRPDVLVGIDAPDFNLGLERLLRKRGLETIHYVSPTVWAWRSGRVKRVVQAASRVLLLFPFEARWYRHTRCDPVYVGHPLADALHPPPSREESRAALDLPAASRVLALLPGSRHSEWRNHADAFFEAAAQLQSRDPALEVAVALVNERAAEHFHALQARDARFARFRLVTGDTHRVLAAADVALLVSGTVALEAMLIGTPMVVAYRVSAATYWLARLLVDIKLYSLPNILAGREVVPELVQDAVEAGRLAAAVQLLLDDPQAREKVRGVFAEQSARLRRNANARAAAAVLAAAEGREVLL